MSGPNCLDKGSLGVHIYINIYIFIYLMLICMYYRLNSEGFCLKKEEADELLSSILHGQLSTWYIIYLSGNTLVLPILFDQFFFNGDSKILENQSSFLS